MFWLEVKAAFDEKVGVVRWEQGSHLVVDVYTDDFLRFVAKEDV